MPRVANVKITTALNGIKSSMVKTVRTISTEDKPKSQIELMRRVLRPQENTKIIDLPDGYHFKNSTKKFKSDPDEPDRCWCAPGEYSFW